MCHFALQEDRKTSTNNILERFLLYGEFFKNEFWPFKEGSLGQLQILMAQARPRSTCGLDPLPEPHTGRLSLTHGL